MRKQKTAKSCLLHVSSGQTLVQGKPPDMAMVLALVEYSPMNQSLGYVSRVGCEVRAGDW